MFWSDTVVNKKLSYRRETARQLPTWREGRGLGPPAHSPSPHLAMPIMRMVESESHNVQYSLASLNAEYMNCEAVLGYAFLAPIVASRSVYFK